MDLLVSSVAASIAVYFFAAFLFGLLFSKRPSDREDGIFALLCVALAIQAIGQWVTLRSETIAHALTGDRLRWAGLIPAFALLLNYATTYTGAKNAKWLLRATYASAFVFELLNWRGALHHPGSITIATTDGEAFYRGAPLAVVGVSAYVFGAFASIAVLVFVARAYVGGKRESLPIVVAMTVLLTTLINDIGVASGGFSTAYLVNVGYFAVILGVATTPSARQQQLSKDLERRSKELRTRTRELRRSYEELRTAQEELVRKEQLAAVGELAAVIAHEVRNPLAIMANAVSGLRKQTISRDDQETLLSILDEETSRLNRLVSDLLRYARPVNVQRQELVLPELLERALQIAKAKRDISMKLELQTEPQKIYGDANLLRQVFDNLVDNAVQSMGQDGHLTLRVRSLVDEGITGVAIDIIDTGEGMDTMVQSRARDPFFTTRPSGTGLGLAIVDRIVEAHGGRFWIDSRSGEGTTVTVFLPFGSLNEPAIRQRKVQVQSEPPIPLDETDANTTKRAPV